MVIFGGRQKLLAARRAGAAAPGPSGPAPALPARGGGGVCGPRPRAQPALGEETRSQRLCQPPGSSARRRPVALCPPGIHEPRPASGPGRRLKTDKASRLLRRKVQGPAPSAPERRGLRPARPPFAHPRRTSPARSSPERLRGTAVPRSRREALGASWSPG